MSLGPLSIASSCHRRVCGTLCAVLAALILSAAAAPAIAADLTGEAIYKQDCVRCHGPAGGGTKRAAQPLIGDRSLPQLARLIQETMPENDPGSLSSEDARKVASYVYDGFYSPEAQARIQPPRVDLARLTVAQYRNSVADLIGSFRQSAKPDERRGLRGEYFNSRDFRNDRRVIDRVDPEVRFDFGGDAPAGAASKDGINSHQFCIRWEGSVIAPETGAYAFVIRSDHAVRLYINDLNRPLIDALIKSGSDTEFRQTIFLLAGRSYPLRLEFSKGRQLGVAARQKELPPSPASVALSWKPPHGVEQVIPDRHLTPGRSAEVAVIATPFPPDDRSYGWERGTSISKEWLAATTSAALETAAYVSARLPELAGISERTSDRAGKLRAFAHSFAERAFRRPLSDREKKRYVDALFDAGSDPEAAVRQVVLLVLKSPWFLYPGLPQDREQHAAAARLSYTLWDAPPDRPLLEAAAAGKLRTRDELRRQAERMLADPRTRLKLRQFMLAWLHVDHAPEIAKDTKRFPGFDAQLASDLRTSLELFIDDVLWSERSDFRQLMLSEEAFLNGRLSAFYGGDLAADAPFQKVKLDAGRRSGLVTHPYLLSVFAYGAESSPIHRGVFLARGVLGVSLRPPQEAFVPLPADQHPGLTTRDRVTLQTSPAACVGCHQIINPLGFTLENFDAVGRHREKDNGKPIDVRGSYETRAGTIAGFEGAPQMAKFLAGSEDVHGAFARQLFQHLVKQPVRAYGLGMPEELRKTFAGEDYSIRKLVIEVATIAAERPPAPSP